MSYEQLMNEYNKAKAQRARRRAAPPPPQGFFSAWGILAMAGPWPWLLEGALELGVGPGAAAFIPCS